MTTPKTSTYNFAILDPRPIPAAAEANDKIFQNAEVGVLGIEVTVPALAERCQLGNIDPQHTGGDASRAAIEDAMVAPLPSREATLATVRADLDAVGAMAVFALRREHFATFCEWTGALAAECGEDHECHLYDDLAPSAVTIVRPRLQMVAEADRFARGGWAGPRPFPSRENPWPEEGASAESSRPLAAIAAAVADFRVPMTDRVAMMEHWLLTGEEPAEYRTRVDAERLEMIAALEDGAISVSTAHDGRIAVVESTHRAGTMIGYMKAPVVVALNPEFRVGGGEPHAKFTVCQFEAGYCDLRAMVAELVEREPGWGGSPTIVGSPQGQGSTLSIVEVVEVITHHLKNA